MNGQAGNPLVLLSLISNGRQRLYAVHAMFATNQLLSLEVYVIAPINGERMLWVLGYWIIIEPYGRY